MPIIKSAKKKLVQDKKRKLGNLAVRNKAKEAIKKFKKNPDKKSLPEVYSLVDDLWKKKIWHKNKTSRMKSRLSSILKKGKDPAGVKTVKKGSKKSKS